MLDQVLVSRALNPITSLIAQLVATDRALLVAAAESPRSKCERQQFAADAGPQGVVCPGRRCDLEAFQAAASAAHLGSAPSRFCVRSSSCTTHRNQVTS